MAKHGLTPEDKVVAFKVIKVVAKLGITNGMPFAVAIAQLLNEGSLGRGHLWTKE